MILAVAAANSSEFYPKKKKKKKTERAPAKTQELKKENGCIKNNFRSRSSKFI